VSEFPKIIPTAGQRPDRDPETIRLLRLEDPEALRRILVDHAGKVLALLRKEFHHVLDQQEIEDALSRATLRVWRAGKTYDPSRGTLAAWLYVIARNCALTVLDTKRRHSCLSFVEDMDSQAASVTTAATAEMDDPQEEPNAFAADVRDCIESLAPQQRAVLLADLAAGGTADTEVLADQLKTTRNSIYVSRNNGRKALRKALLNRGHSLVPGEEPLPRRRT
jgi:RNA polymerase sigma factor (sigma-70 family)